MPVIDITVPIHSGMPIWPGDPGLRLSFHKSIAAGDANNVTKAELGLHTGTHIDAPMHFLKEGGGIETISLDILMGPARVVEIENEKCVTAEELRGKNLAGVERLLIRTCNSSRQWWQRSFDMNFCCMTPEAAQILLDHDIKLLGVDYLSVDGKGSGAPVHKLLMPAGVILLEGLNLADVQEGDYELIALPALFAGRDGAPARVVLKTAR